MNLIATAPIFQLNIHKYSITNWEEKKPKLLELLDFSNDDVLQSEVQSDFFTGKGNPSYFDEWINILKDDFNDIFNQGHVIAPLPVATVDTNREHYYVLLNNNNGNYGHKVITKDNIIVFIIMVLDLYHVVYMLSLIKLYIKQLNSIHHFLIL